ncbi:Fc.00g024020.m01.CDS01 [Cosmosporella sp. VM-42]
MSAPNSRKRAAPGASPIVPIPQQMQQQYSTGNGAGDQMLRWNNVGDGSGFVDNTAHAGNSYGLVPTQAQFPQAVPTPTNSLARRQMNRALIPTNPRTNFDPNVDWSSFAGDDGALLQPNSTENITEQDSVEVLEEMAQKAKRDAQTKRKQIPPFVQKLSSFLEERKNEDLIRWSENGDSFIVLDEDEFAKTLIPELFKHNNYASFVRQLNMYGFHKRVGLSDNSMRASERKNKSPSEYSNPYFRRGHPNLLWLINKPKSGSKAKKGGKNADGDADSEEEAVNEEVVGQGLGTSNIPTGRSLPAPESQPLPKKELVVVREELNKIRDQQKLILGAINRLQRNNNDLYNQAVMFQTQHDRHQNSINAILNFLANVFRKTLEDQGNTQSVSDIISSMITNQGQQPTHQGSVVDLGDFISQVDPTAAFTTPHKKARGLLPPIPNQNNRAQPSRNTSAPGSSNAYQPMNHHNPEMGHVTELLDGSPTDTTSPSLRQELESNPHERMMKIINDHNATNSHGLDLPEAAELMANTPNTLNNDQRSKLVNFMASQSTTPSSNKPTPATSGPSMNMNNHNMPSTSVSPPPLETNPPAPSLSPIMQPPMAPPSLHQINTNSVDLDQLQQLQREQDAKISELGSLLGPLSPSGHIPGLGEGEYFDNATGVDIDQFLDTNAFLDNNPYGGHDMNYGGHDGHFGDGDDFNFSLDPDPNNSLHPGGANITGGINNNTPSPAGTEEIQRDDFGLDGSPNRGTKRQRVG